MLKFIAQKIIFEQLGQVPSREHVRLRNSAIMFTIRRTGAVLGARASHYILYSTLLVSLRSTSPPLDGTDGRSALIRFALACFCSLFCSWHKPRRRYCSRLPQKRYRHTGTVSETIVLVSSRSKNILTIMRDASLTNRSWTNTKLLCISNTMFRSRVSWQHLKCMVCKYDSFPIHFLIMYYSTG